MTQVTVKFAPGVDMIKGRNDLSKAPGALKVEQVFPRCSGDEEDDDLERLHVVDVDDAHLPTFLSYCAISFDVEYAEKSSPRRTMMPTERSAG